MPTFVKIGGGTDTSEVTAGAKDVLATKKFIDADGELQTGTMTNKGAVSQAAPYTGTAGYYSSISVVTSGNATASEVLKDKTFMNASGAQTGTMKNNGSCSTSVAVGGSYTGSGYYSSLTVKGPTLSGNATAATVRKGYTFYNTSGTKQTGTMEDKTIDSSVTVGGTYTNTTAGYYTSIKIAGPTLNGNAAADNVLSGKTFYNTSGTKQTGTMANRGALTCTSLAAGASYNGSAGYYSSINITAAAVTLDGNAADDKVLYGYTFYNNSTTKRTGTLRLWKSDGDITSSWKSEALGWTPTYYGAATTNKDGRTKCYLSGTTLWWCLNGSGTVAGRVLAST